MATTPVVLSVLALSWLGFFVHNVADLPGQTILSPESAYPTAVYLALAASWCVRGFRRGAAWLLLGWGAAHLLGGAVVSVLPLSILPFDPEQTLYHYTFHIIYGVTQIPLLVVIAWYLRRPRGPDGAPLPK
ncbi:hypothetical protein ACFYO1_03400 [Nocardia sp. NPDC006044]|uniref:hypothetical protein n=1 Tax=Nocardia sp. NPDC006044 TaxID=3364306 RepID=UPI00367A7C43